MGTEDRIPAEAFPPGNFIRSELEEHGWTQADLAEIIGRNEAMVSALVTGKRRVTPEIAKALEDAFGIDAETWMNLETSYQLWKLNHRDTDSVRRARLWSKAPVREMTKRGWLVSSENVAVLEKRVLDFFEINDLDDEPSFSHAARKSDSYERISPAQHAWLFRARQLARSVDVTGEFTPNKLSALIDRLRTATQDVEEVRHVPRYLADAGIRLLIIEPLPQSRIDGVCFWIGNKWPVIALSMRFDRIDYFWHTLMHELGHLKDHRWGDPFTLDVDWGKGNSDGEDHRPSYEKEADQFAVETLIPQQELDKFIARIHPLYSKAKIINFAARIHVEPGIIVGQLQHRGLMNYSNNREMLTKVRDVIAQSALTDGWGRMLSASF